MSKGCAGTRALRDTSAPDGFRASVYAHVYAAGYDGSGRAPRSRRAFAVPVDANFASAIARQVPDTTSFHCRVLDLDIGYALIEHQRIRAWVSTTDLPAQARAGSEIAVESSVLSTGLFPGFIGRVSRHSLPEAPLSRLYLSIRPHDAPAVLGSLARALEATDLRFSMKVLANPSLYFRTDAAILYVSSDDVEETVKAIASWLPPSGVLLRRRIPLLTWEVLRGVGIADEPDDIPSTSRQMSHGLLVTDWFVTASGLADSFSTMVDEVMRQVRKSGRDPSRPHQRGTGRRLSTT